MKNISKLDESEHLQFVGIEDLCSGDNWLNHLHLDISGSEQQSFWPIGRGTLAYKDKSFATLINFEDHLTFLSVQEDGNFGNNNIFSSSSSSSSICVWLKS